MLLATVSLSTATHLVGLVGPYKQPYRKTLSLNRARYIGGRFASTVLSYNFVLSSKHIQYLAKVS